MITVEHYSAKSNIYYILSHLYTKPTRETINHVKDNLPYLKQSLKALSMDEEVIQKWNLENVEEEIEDIEVEYTRLFLGSPPIKAVCSPYESYWKQNTIMGSPVENLSRLFNEFGLEISKDYVDLPDHVSVELEFMFIINKMIVNSINANEKNEVNNLLLVKRKFVDEHLDWINDLCVKIESESKLAYFRNLAVLTRLLLKYEIEEMS